MHGGDGDGEEWWEPPPVQWECYLQRESYLPPSSHATASENKASGREG